MTEKITTREEHVCTTHCEQGMGHYPTPAAVEPLDRKDREALAERMEAAMTDDGHRQPRTAETRYLAHVAAGVALAARQPAPTVTDEQREAIVQAAYWQIAAEKNLTIIPVAPGRAKVPGHWRAAAEERARPYLAALGIEVTP